MVDYRIDRGTVGLVLLVALADAVITVIAGTYISITAAGIAIFLLVGLEGLWFAKKFEEIELMAMKARTPGMNSDLVRTLSEDPDE